MIMAEGHIEPLAFTIKIIILINPASSLLKALKLAKHRETGAECFFQCG